ncbi:MULTISPECIES: DMT family transporter [Paenibacillus]|uniref:EamA family transporter n=1 Tax=Paenibacillus validus TaxID=44253 RepID=A0A7X2ZBJ8_9BACL|nr:MULTISPECIES: DMT family transporter [Paenibacillus]MUG71913.1 EamA family transporter [Paenibacillus validus]
MGYVLLLLATLSWSFVGILVKTASMMLDSMTITFMRFALGVVFLGGFLWIKRHPIKIRFDMKWIWLGAAGKCCNYFFENIALSIGYSYGNILVTPIQTIILLVVSAVWLKEKLTVRAWAAALLCIAGVLLISWNGLPLALLLQGGAWTTVLYAISGLGTAFHVLSQRMLIKEMDAGNMNFSVFLWCSLLMALPLPFQASLTGPVGLYPILALALLGVITGLSFYWFSQALRVVSFPVAVIISNCGVLFSILWSYLFFREPITEYILGGAAIFVVGLLVLNLPMRPAKVRQAGGLEASDGR